MACDDEVAPLLELIKAVANEYCQLGHQEGDRSKGTGHGYFCGQRDYEAMVSGGGEVGIGVATTTIH